MTPIVRRHTRMRRLMFISMAVALWWLPTSTGFADQAPSREYQIKAAILYNLLKFVDWPQDKTPDSNEPLIIGLIGQDPFLNSFDPILEENPEAKPVTIRRFPGFSELEKAERAEPDQPHPQIQTIRESHLLFICRSELQHWAKILKSTEGHGVLTVADSSGFLEAGGIINLVTDHDKIRFEVNTAVARRAALRIRSRLLRLAVRVLKTDKPHADN